MPFFVFLRVAVTLTKWKIYDAPSFAVGERDSLSRHFEMDHCCRWTWIQSQSTLGCLGNGLGSRQRFSFHRVQVEHVAGLFMREMRKYGLCCMWLVVYGILNKTRCSPNLLLAWGGQPLCWCWWHSGAAEVPQRGLKHHSHQSHDTTCQNHLRLWLL